MNARDRARRDRNVWRHAHGLWDAGEPSATALDWDAEKQRRYDAERAAYEQRQKEAARKRREAAGTQGAE